ncbi:methylenetetrahydrofolate reductase [NAD(P)H] [Bermanella marisrubri]|uniref:Methylenetetrahydrofolate reductase n=1 Tax=Bermanella marisrubri TaxID=207949 RepID=Q1MYH5_9GAMM|nr:methylenetetrahydrofolate reductase [NAD(P)H] [Bermanella marisrubri]EAT11056.1 5,10-methylenetetrahydrofolate reductase [Oceanobacter sp. RED65] [Bermanella marisrubri]QIZ82961.1 methylenetetrahydrofolate reductase [NAD(P)H] [Bermanella marisrubri]
MEHFRLSFEFFPTKTEEGTKKLYATRDKLAELKPDFFSVTFGAGGSTRDHTMDVVTKMNGMGVGTAPHLSCIGQSKDEIKQLLSTYADNKVERIVALRGDLPSGMAVSSGELKYANELVELIKQEHGDQFHLEVAAYPEMHPQAPNFEADLENFKRKVEAGADSAITQYFFNPDSYFYYVDRCMEMGIEIPIVPGIMPITNYSKLARFSDACGAEIPRWIRKQLEAYGDDVESIQKFGEEVVTQMCEDLVENDVPGLHFYTLNQADPCINIWKNLGLW